MIILGLSINIIQAIVMLIVLLNLLIAIISEQYEQARSQEEEVRY